MGGVMLALALLMLVLGQFWLNSRLSGPALLVYWTICFLFTAGAMVAALVEMRRVRRRTYEEQRKIFEETLGPIPPKPPLDRS
jgi:hypothetical protein